MCFFGPWSALAFWKAKDQTRLAPWVVTGALVGLGMLAKYTAAIELICFAIFCLWHVPSRPLAFPKAEPLGAIETTEAGRTMKRYKLFLCRRPAAVADDSKWN